MIDKIDSELNDIEQRVYKTVSNTLKINIDKITNEQNLVNDLGADSLELVELVMALEEEFNCEISDQDASKIITIADVVKYLNDNNIK